MDKNLLLLALVSALCGDIQCKVCHKHKASHIVNIEEETEQLKRLAEARFNCSLRILTEKYPSKGLHCNITFDDVMCWPFTPAGTVAVQKCPNYIHKFNTRANASRLCLPNGEWYFHEPLNRTWSDYSSCFIQPEPSLVEEHMPKVKILYNIGYSISLASLTLAVFLMLVIKKLHCQRNKVHINLFFSFILRCIICFIKDIDIVPPGDVVLENESLKHYATGSNWKCKLVYSLFHYLLTANYMWIFVEGLYLYTIIFYAMLEKKKLLKVFAVIGWGSPLLCVVPWVIVRIYLEDTMCWNTNDPDNGYYWIIKGPIMATIIVNFFFFVNIVRVLFTKLTAANTRDPKKYRKLAKSTLVLISLFGVYDMIFVGIPYCLEEKYQVIRVYVETLFHSFQGFVVSLLFCFLNGEVRAEIQKKWKRQLQRRRSVASTTRASSIASSFFGKDRTPSFVMNEYNSTGLTMNNSNDRNGGKKNVDNNGINLNGHIKSSLKTVKYTKMKRNESNLSNSVNVTDDSFLPMLLSERDL